MAPDCITLFHTMSNPNTNALMTMLTNAVQKESETTAAGFKIVYIGKDKVPLNILEMTPIDSPAWKKSASFESLCTTLRGQADIHVVSDLLSLASLEIPIDTTSAYMEATRIKDAVVSSTYDILNLTGLAFIRTDGNQIQNLVSSKLEDRKEDMVYIKLGCCIDGKAVDTRIDQPPIDVQYCLKLPQSSYNKATGKLETLATPSSYN